MRREKQSIQRESMELAGCTGTLDRGLELELDLSLGFRSRVIPYFGLSKLSFVLACCESLSLSRRDPAQPLVLQVGTPSFGKSHCVNSSHAMKKTIIQTQSGICRFYLRYGWPPQDDRHRASLSSGWRPVIVWLLLWLKGNSRFDLGGLRCSEVTFLEI